MRGSPGRDPEEDDRGRRGTVRDEIDGILRAAAAAAPPPPAAF
jgi:hypothetical protein